MQRIVRMLLPAMLIVGALAALPAAASAKTHWLCKPGQAHDPCTAPLTATVFAPDGTQQGILRARVNKRAPIDCFYVYPTVSGQPTPAANFAVDPEERAIAQFQASRFSQDCRIWAPVYRQITLAGLLSPSSVTPAMRARAYTDVRNAWRDYLAHDNHGRGVVLIGHSQGSFVLRTLIAKEIDRKPAVRRLLVSALLLGGNVEVRKGSDRGGDFKNVRACHSSSQTGCVVAYSTYNQTPPPNSLFGRVAGSASKRLEVLCTNPASLRGGRGTLDSFNPAAHFPGILGTETDAMTGPLPQVSTPWIATPGSYRARCSSAGGANVLLIQGVPGARALTPEPDATWGLHLADVNIALGNLTDLVKRQSAAYLR